METHNVAVRLRVDVLARLDALTPHLSNRGREGKRSDVLRAVIMVGLEVVEADPSVMTGPSSESER